MTRPLRASAGAWGLAFAIVVLLATSPPSGADPGNDAALFGQTAAVRTQRRLSTLVRSAELDAIAQRHAQRLAASAGPAFHNPALRAEAAGWQAVGEVVGRITAGPGWDSGLVQSWLGSPVHRNVILSGVYTSVGIGTARSANGLISAVEVLGRGSGVPRPSRASRQAAPANPRPPRVAPPPTVPAPPPTTAVPPPPPTTTTTTPPTTVPASILPHFEIAAGPPSEPRWPFSELTATAALAGCCAGLSRAVRRRATR